MSDLKMSETCEQENDDYDDGDLDSNENENPEEIEDEQAGEMVDLDEMPDENMDDEESNKPEEVEVNLTEALQQKNKKKVDKNDFEIISVLGKGGFGKVLQVKKTTGRDKDTIYAMKIVKKVTILKSEKDITHTKAERNILQDIQHPFIVDMKYAFQTEGKLYMILEFAQGGELFNLLEQENIFDEVWAAFYLAEITLALGHLHTNGVIYRDLKPENILLDRDGHVKLADFGLCKQNVYEGNDNLAQTFCGTVEYMAPEIVKNNYRRQYYGKEVDWWSLGILMYDMMNGQPPFQADTKQKTMELVMHGRFASFPFWTHHHKDLQFKLLKRDRCKRLGYGANDYKDILNHKFFMKIDMKKLLNREIEPPYVPDTKDVLDKSGFDEKFTSMPIAETPMDQEVNQVKKAIQDGVLKPRDYSDVFDGFSYVDPRVMESFVPELTNNPELVQSFLGRSFRGGASNLARSLHAQQVLQNNQAQTINTNQAQKQIIRPQQATPQPPLLEVTKNFGDLSTKENVVVNQQQLPPLPQVVTTQASNQVLPPNLDISSNQYPTQQPPGMPNIPYPQMPPPQAATIGGYHQNGLWTPFPNNQQPQQPFPNNQSQTIPTPMFNQFQQNIHQTMTIQQQQQHHVPHQQQINNSTHIGQGDRNNPQGGMSINQYQTHHHPHHHPPPPHPHPQQFNANNNPNNNHHQHS